MIKEFKKLPFIFWLGLFLILISYFVPKPLALFMLPAGILSYFSGGWLYFYEIEH